MVVVVGDEHVLRLPHTTVLTAIPCGWLKFRRVQLAAQSPNDPHVKHVHPPRVRHPSGGVERKPLNPVVVLIGDIGRCARDRPAAVAAQVELARGRAAPSPTPPAADRLHRTPAHDRCWSRARRCDPRRRSPGRPPLGSHPAPCRNAVPQEPVARERLDAVTHLVADIHPPPVRADGQRLGEAEHAVAALADHDHTAVRARVTRAGAGRLGPSRRRERQSHHTRRPRAQSAAHPRATDQHEDRLLPTSNCPALSQPTGTTAKQPHLGEKSHPSFAETLTGGDDVLAGRDAPHRWPGPRKYPEESLGRGVRLVFESGPADRARGISLTHERAGRSNPAARDPQDAHDVRRCRAGPCRARRVCCAVAAFSTRSLSVAGGLVLAIISVTMLGSADSERQDALRGSIRGSSRSSRLPFPICSSMTA